MEAVRLTKLDSGGNSREWTIWVSDKPSESRAEIFTLHGRVGGKLVQKEPTIVKEGKNLGKRNATTYLEQAVAEARRAIRLKLDKDSFSFPATEASTYAAIDAANASPAVPSAADPFFKPMLAVTYDEKREKKLKYPVITQPKIDGVRCLYSFSARELRSRTGGRFNNFDALHDGLSQMRLLQPNVDLLDTVILDGELGSFDGTLTFQEATGIIKRKKTDKIHPHEGDIKYFLYDLFDSSRPLLGYSDRLSLLREIVGSAESPLVAVLPHISEVARSKSDIDAALQNYVSRGYEGAMVRNLSAPYEQNKRSKHLLKVKQFLDLEFEIVGCKEAVGNDAGTAVFRCKIDDDKEFDVRPKGSREERARMWQRRESLMGKMLTVKFFDVSPEGIPRFPVGIAIRDYE